MTNEEKFAKGIVLYEYEKDFILELWESSTKHPDCKFYYSDWKNKSRIIEDKYQLFQWLLYVASTMQFPFSAKKITDYALENWYNWE